MKALKNVDMHVKKGEVHALCGENGAEKSTLSKFLFNLSITQALYKRCVNQ